MNYGLFQLEAGIGYAESNTFFSRPFDHANINGGNSLEIRHFRKYTINKLIFTYYQPLVPRQKQEVFPSAWCITGYLFQKMRKRQQEVREMAVFTQQP